MPLDPKKFLLHGCVTYIYFSLYIGSLWSQALVCLPPLAIDLHRGSKIIPHPSPRSTSRPECVPQESHLFCKLPYSQMVEELLTTLEHLLRVMSIHVHRCFHVWASQTWSCFRVGSSSSPVPLQLPPSAVTQGISGSWRWHAVANVLPLISPVH